jgi:arabinofuranosyltransferase
MFMLAARSVYDSAGRHRRTLFVVLSYALVCGAFAVLMRGIRFDDPYITYRYVDNLVNGLGFRYNPSEATLITTAPLYALLLVLLRLIGLETATAGFLTGVFGIFLAAVFLYRLLDLAKSHLAAYFGGLLLLVFPLQWLTVGFETPLFIALSLLCFLLVQRRAWVAAGVVCGMAIGLRGDGFIVTAVAMQGAIVLTMHAPRDAGLSVVRRAYLVLKPAAAVLLAALLVYAPLAVWLTVQFGSPLPTTLQTKSAQAVSGLTGFYPFTNFIEGAGLLIQAIVATSPVSLLFMLACLIGLVVLVKQRESGYVWVAAWAVAQLVGYTVLGVAPYVWYFAPMTPAVVSMAVLAVMVIVNRAHMPTGPKMLMTVASCSVFVVVLLAVDAQIIAVVGGATPPQPTDLRAKLLPETKVDVYERVGRWLQFNTPQTSTVGVTELGVMGYFGQRHTIDFLGLTQPQYLPAIRHGDYLQALLREQPDYVALSSVNAIYDSDPQRTDWFHAMYTSVATFADARFWGSPMVIWRRQSPAITSEVALDVGDHPIGDGWSIVSLYANSREIHAEQPTLLRIKLRAGARIGTRTLRVQPVLIAGGDGLPVSSQLIHTNQWKLGEIGEFMIVLMPQANPPKGGYVVSLGWSDEPIQVSIGNLKVSLGYTTTDTVVAPLSDGYGVDVITEPVTLCVGTTQPITLTWHAGAVTNLNYTAFVQIRDGAQIVTQADAPPLGGTYPTSVWTSGELIADPHLITINSNVTPGDYQLVVGLYEPISSVRMPVYVSQYRTDDGGLTIAIMHVRVCK